MQKTYQVLLFLIIFFNDIDCVKGKSENKQTKTIKEKKKKRKKCIIQSFLTCMANTHRLYSNFLKQKKGFTKEKTSTPTGLAWYTNRGAVSLFGNLNIAAVMNHYCAVCKFRKIFANLYFIPLIWYELTL